jgi:hypothetical protein
MPPKLYVSVPSVLTQTWYVLVPVEHIAVWHVTDGEPPQPAATAAIISVVVKSAMASLM